MQSAKVFKGRKVLPVVKMRAKALLIALILLSFTLPHVSANSAEKANVTLTCTPLIVKTVDSEYGPKFIAEGTCMGYALNTKNATLIPGYSVYDINVSGPFYREDESVIQVKNGSYKPGNTIPLKIHLRARYKPFDLIPWVLEQNSVNVSIRGRLWFHIQGENKHYVLPIGIYWKGTVPVKVDWVSILAGLIIGIPVILGLVLAPIASGAVKGKRLRNTLWNAGFFFGWLVAPVILSASLETQIGGFVVVQLLFLAVWFSSINYALYLTLSKPVKTPGNIALALYSITVIFSFVWAIKTGNSEFLLGALILIVIFGVPLTMGIQRGLDELKVKGDEVNPRPLGVLLFIAYFPFLLLWCCVVKSIQLAIFATALFGLTLLAGLLTIRHYRENGNIPEPANLY